MRRLYLSSLAAILMIGSCAPYRDIKTVKLHEGMTRDQVHYAIKKKKDKTIAKATYPQGNLVVYQYASYEPWMGTVQDKMYLYFMNDTLIRYAPPEEWKEGAEKAIAKRYGN